MNNFFVKIYFVEEYFGLELIKIAKRVSLKVIDDV